MKLTHCLVSLVFASLLFACTRNSSPEPPPLVFPKVEYPEANKLAKDNDLQYVEIKNGVIRGFNQTHFFETSDDFKNFTTWSFATSRQYIDCIETLGDKVAMIVGTTILGTLLYSHDFGKTYKIIKLPIPITYLTAGRAFGNEDLHWVDDNTLLLVTAKALPEDRRILTNPEISIWQVDLAAQSIQLLSTIPNYKDAKLTFSSPTNGWIVLQKEFFIDTVKKTQNTSLAMTSDGGRTWSPPVLIDSFIPYQLKRGADNHLFLHHFMDSGYFSIDGGLTWKMPKSSPGLNSVQVFNASNIYGVDNTKFYKSTDLGSTWSQVPELDPSRGSLGILNFSDQQVGVSFTFQALFVTRDGGQKWKRLIYPE